MVVRDRKAVTQGERSSHRSGHFKQSDNSQSAQDTHWRDPRKVKDPAQSSSFQGGGESSTSVGLADPWSTMKHSVKDRLSKFAACNPSDGRPHHATPLIPPFEYTDLLQGFPHGPVDTRKSKVLIREQIQNGDAIVECVGHLLDLQPRSCDLEVGITMGKITADIAGLNLTLRYNRRD